MSRSTSEGRSSPELVAVGPFAALSHRFRIETSSRALAEHTSWALDSLRDDEAEAGVYRIVPSAAGHGYQIRWAGERMRSNVDASRVPEELFGLINHAAVTSTAALTLHAGVVAEGGRAVLLVGASKSGKSTLTTALVQAGFEYLSEELAPIDPSTGAVVPYPRPISVRRRSSALLDGSIPPPRADDYAGPTSFYPPDAVRQGCVGSSAVPVAVVLLHAAPDWSTLEVEVPSRAQALRDIAAQTFQPQDEEPVLPRLLDLIDNASLLTIRGGSLADRVRRVTDLLQIG